MKPTADEVLLNLRWADGLDVLVLSALIYIVWQWLQKRTTRTAAVAALGVVALYSVSQWLSMYLTAAVFRAGFTVMLFALVVIFQDDLRHAVDRLSVWRPFGPRPQADLQSESRSLEQLIEAVRLLARERIGTLIVLPGRQSIERHIRAGTRVDGLLSVELLHSIFHSGSRGHDGAVIVDGSRIDRLGVHLPLSTNLAAVGKRGTRHAAALGLAERTDALVIVVSEERGSIALAAGDDCAEVATAAELEQRLQHFLTSATTHRAEPGSSNERWRKVLAQMGSVTLAVLLWLSFAFQIETVQRTFDNIPVEYGNLPDDAMMPSASPDHIRITLVGPERAFAAFDPTLLKATVDVRTIEPGQSAVRLSESHLDLPESIHLQHSVPPAIQIQLDRMVSLTLPVRVVTEGTAPDGWFIVRMTVSPKELPVRMRPQMDNRLKFLRTEPIDVSTARSESSQLAVVQIPEGVQLVGNARPVVHVQIEMRQAISPDRQSPAPRGEPPSHTPAESPDEL